jgi:hypothetical protein
VCRTGGVGRGLNPRARYASTPPVGATWKRFAGEPLRPRFAVELALPAEFAPFTIPVQGPEIHQPETPISPTAHHDQVAVLAATRRRPEQDLEQSTLKVGARSRPEGELKTSSVGPVQALGVHGFPPGDISPSGLMGVSLGPVSDACARPGPSGSWPNRGSRAGLCRLILRRCRWSVSSAHVDTRPACGF